MEFGDFKVFIQERPQFISNRIYLYKYENGLTTYFKADGTIKTAKNGEVVDDDAYFAEMTNDQLQGFANALAEKGIKTNKDSIAEGKLQATEKHLEDMRTIALSKYANKAKRSK